MADPNLEAFYAELDARMAMPDYWNLSNFFDHRRKYCIMPFPAQNRWLILVSPRTAPLALLNLFPRSTIRFLVWNLLLL